MLAKRAALVLFLEAKCFQALCLAAGNVKLFVSSYQHQRGVKGNESEL